MHSCWRHCSHVYLSASDEKILYGICIFFPVHSCSEYAPEGRNNEARLSAGSVSRIGISFRADFLSFFPPGRSWFGRRLFIEMFFFGKFLERETERRERERERKGRASGNARQKIRSTEIMNRLFKTN